MSVSIVLLAAGSSRRFGEANKLLAPMRGVPIVRVLAETLVASRASDIVVVTGPDGEAVRGVLDGLAVRFVANEAHLAGIGHSIAVGVGAVGPRADGTLIVPGDMPLLPATLIDALIYAFEAGGNDRIVVPVTSEGEQRNPVLWPRRCFAELYRLDGDCGGKALLERLVTESDLLVVQNADVFGDIDTLEDLAVLTRESRS